MSYPARRQLEERQETTKEHFAFRVSKYISANAKEAFVVVVVMYNTSKYIEALYLLSSFFVWHLTGHEHGKTSGGTSIEEKEVIEIIIIMTWNEGMNDSFDTHLSRRLFQSCMVLIQSPPLYATYYCFFSSPNTAHFYFLLFSSTFVRLYLIEYLLLLNMLNIHFRYFMEVSYCRWNAWRRSEFFISFIYV